MSQDKRVTVLLDGFQGRTRYISLQNQVKGPVREFKRNGMKRWNTTAIAVQRPGSLHRDMRHD